MKYSVLLSLYTQEKPAFLEECLLSIKNQTIKIYEVVIVEDGLLTEELYSTLAKWERLLPIKRVALESNVGLGRALNHGLKHCSYPLVARMDTDDICQPTRFEKQIKIFQNHDIQICGSWVSEFETSYEIVTSYRKTPQTHDEIVKFARLKNPLNHPSVMYKKSSVLNVNGYEDVLYFEDYHLWLKLIDSGAKFYNIDEPLVAMRAGLGQLSRRRGLRYGLLELEFLKRCKREGLLSCTHAIKNAIIRFPIRLLPSKGVGKVYKVIRSKEV